MTTSGTYTWTLNRDQLLLRSLQKVNILGEQDTVTTMQAANCYPIAVDVLNGMLKMWSIDGIKVPKRKQCFLFPQLNQNSYQLGSVGTDNCTSSYVAATLSVAAALNATTLTVTSTTGMTAADNIGIQLDTGTRQWTTVVSVNSATSVTITTGLTSTAAVNNTVIDYTTKINRPLQVVYGTSLDLTSSQLNEVEMAMISHDEYLKIPVKNTVGRPNNAYYDGVLFNSNPFSSTLYLFPQPNTVSTIHRFIYVDQIQDMANASDSLDLPIEWYYPVMWNLAAELCTEYGKFEELPVIQSKADKMYGLIQNASADNTTLKFKVDTRNR